MSFSQIPGALMAGEAIESYGGDINPDQAAVVNSVCIDCGRPHTAVLCLDDHNARDRSEREGLRQTAFMAAEQMARLRVEADAWKQIATAAMQERDTLLCQLQARHVQATFDAPYLVAVGREAGR